MVFQLHPMVIATIKSIVCLFISVYLGFHRFSCGYFWVMRIASKNNLTLHFSGVRLTYAAICNRLWWQFHTFPYSDTEGTCVWKTALTFVDSICEIWGPLLHGRTLLILSRETTRDPQKLVKVLSEHQVYFEIVGNL